MLGPLQVVRDGEVVPIGGPNVRLTLALLLSQHSTVVSVDRIADAVWGDDPPPSFVATIQGNVSRLRRLLGPEADLVARAPGYVLVVPPDLVDRGRFESLLAEASGAEPAAAVDVLDRALACWRGHAFEEFEDRDWARGEAVRLEELHLVATEQLFEARLALGEHRAIVGELERQVVEHPLRERFWRQLMLALYRSGRQPDALRRAAEHRRLLRDEVGLDPSSLALELERSAVLTDATRFVGRDDDLVQLADLIAAHRVVTLTGPGGVGKTRLALQLAANQAAADESVCVVELAHAWDDASATQAVATALDVQRRQHRSLEATLVEHLSARRVLLVLDNCEHLLDWVGPFVDRVRVSGADVVVLATSREPLGLPGERIWPVGPTRVATACASSMPGFDKRPPQLPEW